MSSRCVLLSSESTTMKIPQVIRASNKKVCWTICFICFVIFICLYYKTSAFEPGRVAALFFNKSPHSDFIDLNSTKGFCTIYQREKEPEELFNRNILKTPSGDISIFTYGVQDLISRKIAQEGTWEGDFVNQMDEVMRADPNINFLDIGSNLGVYTFAAAKRGRKVVAVDANISNMRRMRQTVLVNGMEDRITLVYNAISDKRESVFMAINPFNVGGSSILKMRFTATSGTEVKSIRMNDLLAAISFKKAIMKFDIENKEYEALQHADLLFSKINIRMVIMEWSVARYFDRRKADHIASFFYQRGYRPYNSPNSTVELNNDVMSWPWDVVWTKSN